MEFKFWKIKLKMVKNEILVFYELLEDFAIYIIKKSFVKYNLIYFLKTQITILND